MKKEYFAPEIEVMLIVADIITYSETEEWDGPLVKPGEQNLEP